MQIRRVLLFPFLSGECLVLKKETSGPQNVDVCKSKKSSTQLMHSIARNTTNIDFFESIISKMITKFSLPII